MIAQTLVYTNGPVKHETSDTKYIKASDEHGTWICDIVKRSNGSDWNVEVYDGKTGQFERVGYALSLRDAKKLAQSLADDPAPQEPAPADDPQVVRYERVNRNGHTDVYEARLKNPRTDKWPASYELVNTWSQRTAQTSSLDLCDDYLLPAGFVRVDVAPLPPISGGSHDLTTCPECGATLSYGLPCDCQHDTLTADLDAQLAPYADCPHDRQAQHRYCPECGHDAHPNAPRPVNTGQQHGPVVPRYMVLLQYLAPVAAGVYEAQDLTSVEDARTWWQQRQPEANEVIEYASIVNQRNCERIELLYPAPISGGSQEDTVITLDDLNAVIQPEMEELSTRAGFLDTYGAAQGRRFDRAVDECWEKGQEHFDFSNEDTRRAFEDALIAAIEPVAPNVAADWRSNQGHGASSYPWNN